MGVSWTTNSSSLSESGIANLILQVPASFRLLYAYGSGVCGGVSLLSSNVTDWMTVFTLRDGSDVQNRRVISVCIVSVFSAITELEMSV